jgi:hypothetical protein
MEVSVTRFEGSVNVDYRQFWLAEIMEASYAPRECGARA